MIQESGAVPGCPKASVTTSRAKALPQLHNLLALRISPSSYVGPGAVDKLCQIGWRTHPT